MRWFFTILWRLIFGGGSGNYLGCLSNEDLDSEIDIVDQVERKTA